MLATTTKLFFLTFKCPYIILRFNFIGVLVTYLTYYRDVVIIIIIILSTLLISVS